MAVDAPKALDETHRIPVDVIVEHSVAVLQVLTLGDAVGGNQQVDVHTVVRRSTLARRRGKVAEDGVEIIDAGRGAGSVPGDCGNIQPQFLRKVGQILVQVLGCVLEGGERQQLAVGLTVPVGCRMFHFVANRQPDFLQLCHRSPV